MPVGVSTEPEVLDQYVADTYWKALAARAAGAPLGPPDVVVKPRTDEEVAGLVRVANQHRVPVVPWGGGSGTQGASIPTHGGIVVDLTGMDRIIDIDEVSMIVTAEAGVNGKRLEAELNQKGLMLPHYPASAEFATVGGYVAARGSGVLSRRFEVVSFPSVESGVDAVRKSLQSGLRPSVVRLYDETATRLTLSPVVGSNLPGVSTVLCFEGSAAVVDAERESMLKIVRAGGGEVLDGSLGEIWWNHRYDFYKPPHAPELPAVWGTIDVVATYSRLLQTYHALQEAVAKPYAARGLKLRSHLSHWYPWGAMIYARFVMPDGGPDSVTLHDRIWKDGVTAALGAGAVINDHHGVGLKLAPFMAAQHGAGLDVLRRIKAALDPNGLMNPGKLGL